MSSIGTPGRSHKVVTTFTQSIGARCLSSRYRLAPQNPESRDDTCQDCRLLHMSSIDQLSSILGLYTSSSVQHGHPILRLTCSEPFDPTGSESSDIIVSKTMRQHYPVWDNIWTSVPEVRTFSTRRREGLRQATGPPGMPALFTPFWQSNNIYDSSLHHLHEISLMLKSSAGCGTTPIMSPHGGCKESTKCKFYEILPARMSYIDRQQVHKPV